MHEYYFKIRKGDIEFECSTTDKITFEQQLSDWINGLVNGQNLPAPQDEVKEKIYIEDEKINEDKPQRSGFIDVKNLTSINQMITPPFEIIDNKTTEELPTADDFENILQSSITNPKTEVIEKKEPLSDFEQFLANYNPETQLDYLLITALFIMNKENLERFTIKQLNAKIVPLSGNPIDHAMIQEAIEENYIRVVPDLTGTSEFTEYTLTENGENYFIE